MAAGPGHGVGKDPGETEPGQVVRGHHLDPEAHQVAQLGGLEAARADHRDALRVEHWPVHPGQLRAAQAEQGGQGHAVRVAGGGGFGHVGVQVGVDPHQARGLAQGLADAAPGAGGDAVVAAQDHQPVAPGRRLADRRRQPAQVAAQPGQTAGSGRNVFGRRGNLNPFDGTNPAAGATHRPGHAEMRQSGRAGRQVVLGRLRAAQTTGGVDQDHLEHVVPRDPGGRMDW